MANQDIIDFAPESQAAIDECISIRHAFTGILEQAGLRGFANINPLTKHLQVLYYADGPRKNLGQYLQMWCRAALELHAGVVESWSMINLWNHEPMFGSPKVS